MPPNHGEPTRTDGADPATFDEILASGGVRTEFQPIVDLDRNVVVAYEALSRGPVEGPFASPDALFTEARRVGRVRDLDALCRRSALESAAAAGLRDPVTLFINVEPETLRGDAHDELLDHARSPADPMVVLEITERSLGDRPAELLRGVQRLRTAGWRIALDDVGDREVPLAFMPLLHPEVVKLHLRLVQNAPDRTMAQIVNAVNAYAERTGAVILAEGIESKEHLAVARALGARLGQGWLFGPAQDGVDLTEPTGRLELPAPFPAGDAVSLMASLPSTVTLRQATRPLLRELTFEIEREALRLGTSCLVLAAVQDSSRLTRSMKRRYTQLAANIGFVAVIGEGVGAEPMAGVRGVDLRPGDPSRDEWAIVVMAPQFTAALVARELDKAGPDEEQRFEFVLTYTRDTVVTAAHALLARIPLHP